MSNETIIIDLAKDWTDYIKLVADVLGPLLTALFGYWIFQLTKKIEQSQWRSQKLIEKRIAIWDQVAPKINNVYCYCMRIGAWKDYSPQEVISWKRDIDQLIHINSPYFSSKFYMCYQQFMDVCFATYQGHGVDAKLKNPLKEYREVRKDWKDEWNNLFYGTSSLEEDFISKYHALQHQLSAELK